MRLKRCRTCYGGKPVRMSRWQIVGDGPTELVYNFIECETCRSLSISHKDIRLVEADWNARQEGVTSARTMDKLLSKFDPPKFAQPKSQLKRVKTTLMDGKWRTLEQLAIEVGGSVTSVSARVRDLRKEKFGGYEVARRRNGNSFEYRLVK